MGWHIPNQNGSVVIMARSISRCIDNVRPKTVAPVKEWTVRNCFVRNLTQVRNLNFEKWKLNQGQFLQLNMFVSGVALLRRRHFEYRHMQLSYLNKALVLIKLCEILKKSAIFIAMLMSEYVICVSCCHRVFFTCGKLGI